MRAAIEVFARRWWAGAYGVPGRALSGLLTPASWTWAALARSAGRRSAARAVRVDGLTVVSVGNLAVGGTGKTPFVSWLASRLGGGRRTAILVGGHASDEGALHAERDSDIRVIEGRDRVEGARKARELGCTVALLDDGFQHRGLARDLDVVLVAAEDGFPAAVLPCGPYREGADALARADAVLATRRTADEAESRELASRVDELAPGLVVGGIHLAPAGWRHLDGRAREAPAGDVLAVCGIARPDAFRDWVARRTSGSVEVVAFADHHVYTPADLARIERASAGRPIVTTEKDAVKLRSHTGTPERVHVLAETVGWDWGQEAFLSRLSGLGVRAGSE